MILCPLYIYTHCCNTLSQDDWQDLERRKWGYNIGDAISLSPQANSVTLRKSKDRGMEDIVLPNLGNIQTISNNIQNATIDYSIPWLSNFCNFKVLSHVSQQIQAIIDCSACLKKEIRNLYPSRCSCIKIHSIFHLLPCWLELEMEIMDNGDNGAGAILGRPFRAFIGFIHIAEKVKLTTALSNLN